MSAVKSLEDLKRVKEEALEKRKARATSSRAQITVGMGTCGIATGARETMQTIIEAIEDENLGDIIVSQTGCVGLCEWDPVVEVAIGQEPKVTYGNVSPEKARAIMREHIMGSKIIREYVIPAYA
jgi:NADP-reducing hydrogenase subunit HndB